MMIHASCVAIGDAAILLRGPPGAGKSDLALRLIGAGAELVADDQVRLARLDDGVWATAPETIAGLIEIRGLGLRRMKFRRTARLGLVLDLVPAADIERMPPPQTAMLLGVALRLLTFAPFEASAIMKVGLALEPEISGLDPR